MFFSDLKELQRAHVGDLRPQADPDSYCSAHMGMGCVMGVNRDLLVNACDTGGVDVIDFSDPVNLKEIAHYKFDGTFGSDNWSADPHTGLMFNGPGIPVYA